MKKITVVCVVSILLLSIMLVSCDGLFGTTKAELAENIVRDYKQSHTYIEGVYDCNNMACDVWDILKSKGINARIVVGSVNQTVTSIIDADHAWVLAEVNPHEYLALETTGGNVVYSDDNALYYRGWYFNTPAEIQKYNDLEMEYNTRIDFYDDLSLEMSNALMLWNRSHTQSEIDKWSTLFYELNGLRIDQETQIAYLKTQISNLAKPFLLK